MEDLDDRRVVVCSVAGSPYDGNAIEVARRLAQLTHARLALVAVAAPPAEGGEPRGWTGEEARRYLELTAHALGEKVAVDCHLEIGHPTRRLVDLAARLGALLLVVGTSSPSIVASGITRSAPCPVVVVPAAAPVPLL